MHGLTLLDAKNAVIRPALIWCDQRSQPQVDWINKTAGVDFVVKSTANPMLTGFTLPKLLWVRDNEPANFDRVKKVLLPKDYIRFELTGEYASEVSDASGTGLVRCGESPLGVRACGPRGRGRASCCPPCSNRARSPARLMRAPRPSHRTERGHAGDGRRRRSGGERGGQRHRRAGDRVMHDRHIGRGVRAYEGARRTIRRAASTRSAMRWKARGTPWA